MKVKIKKLNEQAVIPRYSKPGDAGLDLTAITKTKPTPFSNQPITYGTGLAVEIPEGYVGLVYPRSSISKYDQLLTNHVGVIDSGYRGEIQLKFKQVGGHAAREYEVGDRIAQLIIIPYPQVEFEEVTDLSESERNNGSFGSTGK